MNPQGPMLLGDPARLQDPARIARNALDLASAELVNLPIEFDRKVLELLPRAVATLYVALDTPPEAPAHADALHEALAMVDEAATFLRSARGNSPKNALLDRPLTILGDARTLIVRKIDESFERQLRAPIARRAVQAEQPETLTGRPLRASKALPRLHALARPRLAHELTREPFAPEVAGAPPPKIERPKDLEALEAFATKATSGALERELMGEEQSPNAPSVPAPVEYAFDVALEERDALRELARDTLEDIASLSNLRHPIPTETWLDQAPFEQRLLDNLDYFVSLGAACLPQVTLYHREADVPDAMRAFAVAFTLGCIEGGDTIGTAIAAFKQSAPEEWSGFADGFVLAPHPAIDAQVAELLLHPNNKLAAVALSILGRRGTVPEDIIDWVQPRGDRGLTLALAHALGSNVSRDRAIPYLESLVYSDVDDEVWLAAVASALRRGHGAARDQIRDMLSKPPSLARAEGGIELLGLAGHPRDQAVLEYAARTYPTAKVARALGRFGHVGNIPLLIELLTGDEAVAEAAGESLDRITNAGLREVKEEPWDTGLPPELKEAAAAQGAPVPMRKVTKVILDPAQWRAWWSQGHKAFDTSKKYRGGVPFLPTHVVDELEAGATPTPRRLEAAFELACLFREIVRFDPSDWVARQTVRLEAIRADLPPTKDSGAWWFGGAPARGETTHSGWSAR